MAQSGSGSARSQYESSSVAQLRGARRLGLHPKFNHAVLASEIDAIFFANRLYWERGAAASLEERAQYQGRQKRLEEIHAALPGISSLRDEQGVADGATPGGAAMNNEKWEELYVQAAKEINGKKMPERVAAGREAIRGRLQDLEQSADHHMERRRLATALSVLNVLEADAQRW